MISEKVKEMNLLEALVKAYLGNESEGGKESADGSEGGTSWKR